MQINFINYTSVRVRYGETDQMGFCYYGNYAQFFEIGRVEALRSMGLPYADLEASGVMLPVLKYEVDYLSPAQYDDLLEIKTAIVEIKGSKISFNYEIACQGRIVAKAFTSLVFVNKTSMKPIRPPQIFLDLIQPFLV